MGVSFLQNEFFPSRWHGPVDAPVLPGHPAQGADGRVGLSGGVHGRQVGPGRAVDWTAGLASGGASGSREIRVVETNDPDTRVPPQGEAPGARSMEAPFAGKPLFHAAFSNADGQDLGVQNRE